ncbi:MAG: hypothetical protein JXB36_17070 [Gammaproteobacteria bacterium]|nr:hypothetical protein [Gammaproteobacteria bacterium]
MRSKASVLSAAAAMAFALTLSAEAHHGWGGQQSERFELTGTVRQEVSLSNPHATMQIVDADGQVWDLTLAPPSRTRRAGLEEGVIPVGAEVTISGRRNSDPDRYEVKTERVTYEGRNYDVYADRL